MHRNLLVMPQDPEKPVGVLDDQLPQPFLCLRNRRPIEDEMTAAFSRHFMYQIFTTFE